MQLADALLLRDACAIDGQWVAADCGATGGRVGSAPRAGQAETRRALEHGIEDYLELKYLCLGGMEAA